MKEFIFGTTPEGHDISAFEMSNSDGLSIRVMAYGASLMSVMFPDRQGNSRELTLGFDDLSGYLGDHPYFGSTIGRCANRIRRGRFVLNGEEYDLACNEDGRHHLHGGRMGFDRKIWRADPGEDCIEFAYFSPHGEEGYPGNLDVKVRYSITNENELVIEYTAGADQDTPVNLTNHTYWNLAGEGAGTILNHELQMNCAGYLPVDSELIPTGVIEAVSETDLDFTHSTSIGSRIERIPGGYDHCFVPTTSPSVEPNKPFTYLTVTNPESGRCLELAGTQPAVQFYTGNFLEYQPGRGEHNYDKHAGFCIETQGLPDAVNQADFPSVILQPEEEYKHRAIYKFFTI